MAEAKQKKLNFLTIITNYKRRDAMRIAQCMRSFRLLCVRSASDIWAMQSCQTSTQQHNKLWNLEYVNSRSNTCMPTSIISKEIIVSLPNLNKWMLEAFPSLVNHYKHTQRKLGIRISQSVNIRHSSTVEAHRTILFHCNFRARHHKLPVWLRSYTYV